MIKLVSSLKEGLNAVQLKDRRIDSIVYTPFNTSDGSFLLRVDSDYTPRDK